jgi:hypothetical protein
MPSRTDSITPSEIVTIAHTRCAMGRPSMGLLLFKA